MQDWRLSSSIFAEGATNQPATENQGGNQNPDTTPTNSDADKKDEGKKADKKDGEKPAADKKKDSESKQDANVKVSTPKKDSKKSGTFLTASNTGVRL